MSQRSGNELTSLLPSKTREWESLVADVMMSPAVDLMIRDLLLECEAEGEFKSIDFDGTVKPSHTLIGQPSYKATNEEKKAAAVPLDEQKHSTLVGIGITGALLFIESMSWEKAKDILTVFTNSLTWSQLASVEHAAADDVSAKLFRMFRESCPNFKVLSLDGGHLPIKYEASCGEKVTGGSKYLRRIMLKVRQMSGSRLNVSRGGSLYRY